MVINSPLSRNAQLTLTRANVTLQSSDLDKTSWYFPKLQSIFGHISSLAYPGRAAVEGF